MADNTLMNTSIFPVPVSLSCRQAHYPASGHFCIAKVTVFFVLLYFLIPPEGLPVSFDCAKAKTIQEKLICGSAVLSKLDDSLSRLYSLYRAKSPNPEQVKRHQIAWLQDERSQCTTVVSLGAVLRARAAVIRKSIDDIGPENEVIRWKWVIKEGEELYPQFLNPSNDRKLDAVNRAIASDYQRGYYYNDEEPCEEEFDHTIVTMASRGIFSLERSTMTCSSPMASIYRQSYDVKTGAEIDMADLFKNWGAEREKIINFIFKGIDDERVKRGDTSCLLVPTLLDYYTKNEHGEGYIEYTRILFFSDSVSFMPDFPRVIIGCGETVTLACRKLIRFAAPNSVLLRFK